jgi:hypothetical protein
MDKDDLAWMKSDDEVESWEESLHKAELYRAIADLILKHNPGKAVRLHTPIRGGYNVFYQLEYSDGSSAAMRIPCKGTWSVTHAHGKNTKAAQELSSSPRKRSGTR